MFEDKLEEKIRFNQKAVDNMYSKLASMVGSSRIVSGGDNSLVAFTAVLSSLGFKDFRIETDTDVHSDYQTILRKMGIISRPVSLEGRWWKDATGPFLATDTKGDFVALVPGFIGYHRIDPKSGKRIRVNGRTTRDLGNEALCFCKELPKRKLSMKDLLKYALGTISVQNIIITLLLCVMAILLDMIIPFINKFIFNDVVPSGEISGIMPICSFLLGIGLCSVLFSIYRNMVLNRLKDMFNGNLQAAVMARLYSLPNRFFKEFSGSDLSVRALSVNSVYQFISNEIMVSVVVGVFSSMYIFVAFVFAKDLVIPLTFIIIIYISFSLMVYRMFAKRNAKVLPYKTSSQGFVFSLFSGIHKIRNNGAESRMMQQWAERFTKSEMLSADSPGFVRYQKATGASLLLLCKLAVFFFAWKSGTSISDFIAFYTAYGVMLQAFDQLQVVLLDSSQIAPQLQLIQPILDVVPDSNDDSESVTSISGSIELSNVTFRYGPNAPDVIKDMSLTINSGENIGIVGTSGCGKSSLMRLMMGFEQPVSGSVFYGPHNLALVNLNSLHQFTGYCPQELHIFPDTIRNNIRISKPDATDEEIWEAARIACIDKDIMNMPDQLDTVLGEGGSGMSGGQGQRIMIARAVLNRPRIIFFDEATSALDNITQKEVVKNLNELHCTRISIAHRLSTIEQCDRIIVLDKGRIIEDGSPSHLMELKGFFYSLAKRQQL